MSPLLIRSYKDNDHVSIAEIFRRAINEIACDAYTHEECRVWAGRIPSPADWKTRCERKRPILAIVDSRIAGFLEMESDGHIDCAYVHPDFKRRGIMTKLVEHALREYSAQGIQRAYVEASCCAKPLFEKLGFHMVRENSVPIDGQNLKNFIMELKLK